MHKNRKKFVSSIKGNLSTQLPSILLKTYILICVCTQKPGSCRTPKALGIYRNEHPDRTPVPICTARAPNHRAFSPARVVFNPETDACYMTWASFKFTIFPPQPPECSHSRWAPPHAALSIRVFNIYCLYANG